MGPQPPAARGLCQLLLLSLKRRFWEPPRYLIGVICSECPRVAARAKRGMQPRKSPSGASCLPPSLASGSAPEKRAVPPASPRAAGPLHMPALLAAGLPFPLPCPIVEEAVPTVDTQWEEVAGEPLGARASPGSDHCPVSKLHGCPRSVSN